VVSRMRTAPGDFHDLAETFSATMSTRSDRQHRATTSTCRRGSSVQAPARARRQSATRRRTGMPMVQAPPCTISKRRRTAACLREVMVNRRAIRCVRESPRWSLPSRSLMKTGFLRRESDGRLGTLTADDHAGLLAGVGSKGVPARPSTATRHTFEQPGTQVRPLLGADLVVRKHDGQASVG